MLSVMTINLLTPQILNEDILYSVLTTLYNVSLNSEISLRFRIVVTKQLLKQFITKNSPFLRFIAKFSFSCLHRILSRSELNQLTLDQVEVDMLARCLNRVDKFFGGFECLLMTLSKLACFPKNWPLFANGGVVRILMSLSLRENGSTQIYAVRTLLNMIPEPVIVESHSQMVTTTSPNKTCEKPLTSPATKIMVGSPDFMEFVRTHESAAACGDLFRGIELLTKPLENPGV